MWDKIDAGQGSRHEQELISKDNLFKPLLDKGAVMRRYNRTPESAAGVINYLLGGSPTTQIVHEIAQEKMDPEDTPAGTNPHGEILALLQKQKEAIELLEAKMSHNVSQHHNAFFSSVQHCLISWKRHLQTDTRHHDGEQVIAEMHALWQKHKEKMESLTVEIWRILQNAPNQHQSGDKNTSNKEQVIAVMGPTGVGKSSFIHNAVPPDLRTEVKVGHSLRSETNKVQPVSWVNKDGKRVKLVDTPGFNDSRAGMSDVEVLKMIANFLVDECDEKKPRLTGLIYVHRISDPRVGGTALRNLRMFRKLCGKDSMKNVVIVTTMWDMVDKKEGERREQELKSSNDLFKPLLDDGAIMIGYDRTHECANRVVNRLLEKGPTTPQIVQEIVNKGVVLVDTAAGTELQSEIRELLKKHNDEMKSLKTEVRGLKQKVPEQERQRMNEEMQDRQRMEGVMTNLSMELDELKRGIPNDPPLNYEATDNFPPPDTKCIEDCSKLLRLVKYVPSVASIYTCAEIEKGMSFYSISQTKISRHCEFCSFLHSGLRRCSGEEFEEYTVCIVNLETSVEIARCAFAPAVYEDGPAS
ncbi:P-loop containing nucleoside triphosphate hydrolase protein [Scleroderma citrinum]